jgi:hypothetical protein
MTINDGKKPSKKEPEIGSWLSDQLKFYRAGSGTAGMWVSKERLHAWTDFMNKNEDQLLTKDEIWDKKLQMLGDFIDLYGRKPSETGCPEEVALLRWSYDQVKRVQPGTDRYDKWSAFINKYMHLYRTYEESWKDTFDKVVEYVRENNKTPKQDGSTEEECRLSRWITRQNMSLSKGELSEEHKSIWEMFTNKDERFINKDERFTNKDERFNSTDKKVIETPVDIKCKGKDRNGDLCRNYGNPFCNYHNYLTEYTDAQLQQLKFCKGCNKWKDLPSGKNQCLTCGERGAENRTKAKTEVILCKSDGCTFKKSDENNYCGKHQLCLFVDECLAEGMKPCAKYLKGCRAKLGSDYAFKSCQECLEKEREYDKAKRSAVSDEIVDGKKQCTVCCKFKPVEEYPDTKTCVRCREEFKKQNEKRDKEHVNEIQRIASQKPERKATKKEWENANPEKVALKTLNYRDRQYNEHQEEYLKRNAETMAKWRENNPEKVEEANKKNLININKHMYNYTHKCEMNNINFELTKEQFDEIVIKPCYYCEIIQDKGFNGIDRMDSSKGYELDNCVSCCDECNTMKGALDNSTFIKRTEHILTYNKIINCNLHPRAFANHSTINYNSYKQGAKSRNYVFELTQSDFDKIVSYDCYICGKQNSNRHKNGIDRYDNSIGYTTENIRPCCGQCNVMKKDMEYKYFINKLFKIYNCSQNQNYIPVCVPIINTLNRNPNKPSRDEMRKISTEKRQERRKNTREKYGDAEYKRMHAQKIAEQRCKKKNVDNIGLTINEYSTDDEGL